jgi:hypothetical protein
MFPIYSAIRCQGINQETSGKDAICFVYCIFGVGVHTDTVPVFVFGSFYQSTTFSASRAYVDEVKPDSQEQSSGEYLPVDTGDADVC